MTHRKPGVSGYVHLLLLGLSLVAAPAGRAESVDPTLKPVELYISFTRSSFLGVNEADAKAAFKVFARAVGRKRGYNINPHVQIFDDLALLQSEIDRGSQDLLIVDSWDYLTLSLGPNMPVEFSAIEQGVVHEDYVLLVKDGAAPTRLVDLQGKRMIVLESSNANTGRHWLTTELMALGAASPDDFFASFAVTEKPSQAVLPVFFGQADACVVDRSGFEIMAELNPQVGKALVVAHHSAPYLDTIACVRSSQWEDPQYRTDLMDALCQLNTDPGGQQILQLFKFEGMTPFELEHLDTVCALRRRHDALAAKAADGHLEAKTP